MSISDPLLKELKAAFQKFLNKDIITDSDPYLVNFCDILEKIFEKGLVLRGDNFPPPWGWMHAVTCEMDRGSLPRVFPYIRSVDFSKECNKVSTFVGKFRLLIRCCLFYKCLHVPVEAMVRQIGDSRYKWYLPHSILGHEVLGEILLSVLLQAGQLNFKLDITNARLLDLCWVVGDSFTTTLVPSTSLGLTMSFIRNLAVIVRVDPASVAAEDGTIEPGDILDEVNENILTGDDHGRLKTILNRMKNQPITLRIIKTNHSTPERTHPALINLMRGSPQLAVDLGEAISSSLEKRIKEKARSQVGYNVKYLGCHSVGRRGDVTMAEAGIRRVTAAGNESIPVTIECRELEVIVLKDREILMRHKYMGIASCGHSAMFPKHFAYMVGNTGECSSATEYICHVFLADSCDISSAVLLSLGHGFERTQCAA